MNEITLQNLLPSAGTTATKGPEKRDGEAGAFGDLLKNAVNEVDRQQKAADRAISDFATGESSDIHRTMIAIEKADVSFKLLMKVRNKVLSAYEEIQRMQV